MKLPDAAHRAQPWRIHELAPDFPLEDVWALPTPGGPDDFPRLVTLIASLDPAGESPPAARALWAIRERLGALLGWDDPGAQESQASLRARLPADLREGPFGPASGSLPFTPLYLTADEWAVEAINRTVHGILHFGWVADETGAYRGQMAILVKRNGLLGRAYMAAIGPFRESIVYPPLMRGIERRWRALAPERDELSARAPGP